MKTATISHVKAHLSAYLDAVRHGETVVVCDRRTPIARIVPIEDAGKHLVIEPATLTARKLRKIKSVPVQGSVDVLGLLRAERDRR